MTTTTAPVEIPAPIESSYGRPIERVEVVEYRGHLVEVYRTTEAVATTKWSKELGHVAIDPSPIWSERIVWAGHTPRTHTSNVPNSVQGDAAKIIKRAKATIDAVEHDEEILPTLVKILQRSTDLTSWGAAPATLKVGDVAALYSRGQIRPGLVDAISRTGRVTVAYVTAGGIESAAKYQGDPTISRKSAPLAEVRSAPFTV